MKTWMTVLAIWLWLTAIVAPTILVAAQGISHDEYIMQLIKDVRKHISDVSNYKRYGIPVLPDPSTTPDEQKYLELVIPSKWEAIRIYIDITSLRMMAYQSLSTNGSYFFEDTPVSVFNYLFNDTQKHWLPFGGSYLELEEAAEELMQNIELGISELDEAVTLLDQSGTISLKDQARSLIVVNQVIVEALKFRYVEHLVHKSIVYEQSFRADPAMVSLEDKWEELSNAIQQSNQGIFSNPVELTRSNGSIFQVDTVSGVIVSNLALMLFVCKEDEAATSFSKSLLIKPVVAVSTCHVPEPTVHIVGENNSCVTVIEVTSARIPVLRNCTNSGEHQFWTFRKDSTIAYMSTDLCLASFGFPGVPLALHDCNDTSRIVNWHLTGDGSIVTPGSQGAFTAETIITNPVLTLYNISYSLSQSWLATNFYGPFLTTIVVGDFEFCLRTNQDGNLWVEHCVSQATEQNLLLYADGSIRPQLNNSSCVTCLGNEEGSQVSVLPCVHGSTTQRWVFQNDGSVTNLKNGLVIQAANNSQVVLSKYEGHYNQLWLPLI